MFKFRGVLLIFVLSGFVIVSLQAAENKVEAEHVVVIAQDGHFAGWPANNGVWIWEGKEILVGFSLGQYQVSGGHNISDRDIRSMLARSTDGGKTWTTYDPENYVGDGEEPTALKKPIRFNAEGFAMRMYGTAYHGNDDPQGGFFYSYDRGHTWQGPHRFGNIHELDIFDNKELTPRTDYVVLGEKECLVFISARIKGRFGTDKYCCFGTKDGGLSFEVVSWVVPWSDGSRAVMSQSVHCGDDTFVSVARRKKGRDSWIDAYRSTDGGKSWSFAGKVGDTGKANGNPPSLVKMHDGRLCCAYGNRNDRQILASFSDDEGQNWSEPVVIRDDYYSGHKDQDLGYCRIVQRQDGKLVVIYYWAAKEHPQQHIAASIWDPTGE